ncbi:Cyclin-dependent kinases regulatory subunit [Hondaea fermentalgiana]|uniref:Cyclin-dependent kinases regulatory subunit n=1 Tax=Hondaea fermentalgiana TaxID=2315210 RepID=A0A2R5GQS0_9STRA|nr:Cyclin-dependent kinases regulatory subunit [Hondaea fermentalgiana]|eukprot:GBG30973.1 Cyclin-dependent kinases regulatory subunit [Hondaea fermentalgiana]
MPHDVASRIEYSDRYTDGILERMWAAEMYTDSYRHVICPKEIAKHFPKDRLLEEHEWRGYHIQQSRGWKHYAIHKPEQHILLFRRPIGTDPSTGLVNPALAKEEREAYEREFGPVMSDAEVSE